MASISPPFPLALSPLSSKVRCSRVLGSANEIAVSVDGEGLSVHNVHPLVGGGVDVGCAEQSRVGF
jgi:hypothetical protein